MEYSAPVSACLNPLSPCLNPVSACLNPLSARENTLGLTAVPIDDNTFRLMQWGTPLVTEHITHRSTSAFHGQPATPLSQVFLPSPSNQSHHSSFSAAPDKSDPMTYPTLTPDLQSLVFTPDSACYENSLCDTKLQNFPKPEFDSSYYTPEGYSPSSSWLSSSASSSTWLSSSSATASSSSWLSSSGAASSSSPRLSSSSLSSSSSASLSSTPSNFSSVSPADESRPLRNLFPTTPSPDIKASESMTTLFDSVPASDPLAQNPYYSFLCQVLDTDVELKNVYSEQPVKPNISSLERDLYQQLQSLESDHLQAATHLRSLYQQHSSNIEMERFQVISSQGRDGYYVTLLNNHFDDQRVQIIDRVIQSVRLLQQSTLPLPKCFVQTGNDNSTASTPGSSKSPSPSINNTDVKCPSTYVSPAVTTRPILTKEAIRTMETWYCEHLEHPYPSLPVAEELAQTSGITPAQVKKWFANKRCRTKNTKSLTAIACRKRLQKLGALR